jgi:cobalamin biosynthesis Co2+ chelatase CbiK
VSVEAIHAVLVYAHSFPNSIAALYRTIENTDFGGIAVHETVAYPNLDVLISRIELL